MNKDMFYTMSTSSMCSKNSADLTQSKQVLPPDIQDPSLGASSLLFLLLASLDLGGLASDLKNVKIRERELKQRMSKEYGISGKYSLTF